MVAPIEDQLSATIEQMENTLQSSGQQLGATFGQMGSQMEQALAPVNLAVTVVPQLFMGVTVESNPAGFGSFVMRTLQTVGEFGKTLRVINNRYQKGEGEYRRFR